MVAMPGRCRSSTGKWSYIRLDNLSPKGCGLANPWRTLSEGGDVIVRLAGLGGVPGKVRWVLPSSAGVEFDNPLYAPLFEHLCRGHPPDDEEG